VTASLKEMDRLIQSLYSAAVEFDSATFWREALSQLCKACGAVGGAWLTRSRGGSDGEFTEWPADSGASAALLLDLQHRGSQRELDFRPLPAPFASEQGLLLNYSHRSSSLLNSIVLLRFAAGTELDQREELRRATGHMVEAGSLSLRQIVQRDEWLTSLGRPSRGSAALVDAEGVIYATSTRFRELLAQEFGETEHHALPFRLPRAPIDEHGTFSVGSLHLRMSSYGNLYLLHARRPLPLDSLSPREQEIARALAEGKTFKTVARQLDIAVSTVANHASRIYRKLGIFRREELVGLLQSSKIAKAA
jgi:DNA-binding CsgD family transcriptional regulator